MPDVVHPPGVPQSPSRSPSGIPETTVIWLALTVAPVVYTVVGFMTRPGDVTLIWPDLRDPVTLALTVVAILSAIAGFVLPGVIARRYQAALSGAGPADDARRAGAERLVMLVRGALFEAPAIAGFAMVQIGAPASLALPFAALSFALFLTHFPTRALLSRPFED